MFIRFVVSPVADFLNVKSIVKPVALGFAAVIQSVKDMVDKLNSAVAEAERAVGQAQAGKAAAEAAVQQIKGQWKDTIQQQAQKYVDQMLTEMFAAIMAKAVIGF